MTSNKIKGTTSLLGAAFVVGTFGIFARFVSPMLGNVTQTTIRFGLAAAIIAGLHAVYRQKSFKLARRDVPYVILLGFGSFGLGVLFTIAVNNTKIATGLSLLFASSIITALLVGTILFKEKVTPAKIGAIGITLVGLVMYAHSFAALNIGAVAGLAAGVCDGSCNGLRKRLKSADRNLVVMYQYLIGGLFTVPVIFLSSEHAVKAISFGAVAALLGYVVFSVALGNLLLYGFARFDVNIGAVILASQIFFAMVLGMAFLHEFPTSYELAGASLIFLAATLTTLDAPRVWARLSNRPKRAPDTTFIK
jgi:drug/metabolite transporter (DMT)-like permease